MSASLLGVSSHDYIRLLEPRNLAFFSQFTCFRCGRQLWRNGYRQRRYPVSIKLLRLKCQNPLCSIHYTVYPSDIIPSYSHNPETIFRLTTDCLKSASNINKALCLYQHERERRIDDGEISGPDVSTVRRWLIKLSDPVSILSLFLSAQKQLQASSKHFITVALLAASLASQHLTLPLLLQNSLSPTAPVTNDLNQVNGGVSSQNDPNFYNQEHPP